MAKANAAGPPPDTVVMADAPEAPMATDPPTPKAFCSAFFLAFKRPANWGEPSPNPEIVIKHTSLIQTIHTQTIQKNFAMIGALTILKPNHLFCC
jgi:hypothetical protein